MSFRHFIYAFANRKFAHLGRARLNLGVLWLDKVLRFSAEKIDQSAQLNGHMTPARIEQAEISPSRRPIFQYWDQLALLYQR
jgi:hypothetical protein